MAGALIELVAVDDGIGQADVITVSGEVEALDEGIVLDVSPSGIFGHGFSVKLIEGPSMIGGREGQVNVPVLQVVFALDCHDIGFGVAEQVSRVRKLFGPWQKRRRVLFRYTSALSGTRWLVLKLADAIGLSPEQDWEDEGSAHATITCIATEPRYESKAHEVKTPAHPGGAVTYWLPCWNPTDQDGWLEWTLNPGGGSARFTVPDFSHGQEQTIDPLWVPGSQASRALVMPPASLPKTSRMWSVMSVRSGNDPYVAADLSNPAGEMGGVFPLYPMPPHTGTRSDPVLLPVVIDGPAGAEVKLTMRRFWSAESGLE